MADQRIITDADPLYLDDLYGKYQYAMNGSNLEMRRAISPLGFNGVEGTDYNVIDRYIKATALTWRFAVSNGYWSKDYTITALGFGGVEGVDWENFEKSKLL